MLAERNRAKRQNRRQYEEFLFHLQLNQRYSQLTIQGMPNWSTSIPKRCAQNVLSRGMVTLPLSASALNIRSASAGSAMLMLTVKPCG